MNPLDAALLEAHAGGDLPKLVVLYRQAAETTDLNARAFFLTQAYIFALDCGADAAAELRAALVALGREVP